MLEGALQIVEPWADWKWNLSHGFSGDESARFAYRRRAKR